MNIFFPLLSSIFMFIIVVGANHGSSEPQVYWRTLLPHTPMPSVIEQLLQSGGVGVAVKPKGKSANPNSIFFYGNGEPKGKPVNPNSIFFYGNAEPKDKPLNPNSIFFYGNAEPKDRPFNPNSIFFYGNAEPKDRPVNPNSIFFYGNAESKDRPVNPNSIFFYDNAEPKGKPVYPNSILLYGNGAFDTQLHDDPTVALFFQRQDLRAGKKFTLQLDDNATFPTAAFIPRSAAESIPFSTAELPSILSRFSIPVLSAEAAATEKTLRECEAAPIAGETKLCATSLESMVDFATKSIGTREVVAMATEGGAVADAQQVYKVESVRRVAAAAGKGVVVCHQEEYAYAVFFCHATTTSEVYELEMAAAESGGMAVKAMAVCHTDTAGWNPNHLAFRVLKVEPGTVPVCHFLPRDNVVWAGKV